MANEKDIEVTLKVDSTIARARLDEVKKIINELKTLMGDPAAFTKSFDGLEAKVGLVQQKIESLQGVLAQLGETSNAVFVFQDLSTQIVEVNTSVISLQQETNTLIQSFEGVAAAGEKVSAEVVPAIAEKTNELAENTEKAKEKVSALADVFENQLPLVRDNLDKLSGSLEEIKGGFAAAGDLAKVFGLENDNITQTINKLTQAQKALGEAQKMAKTIQEGYAKATKALTAIQTAFNTINTLVTKGFKMLKLAMASTGIGMLVVGIGLLIANFDKVKAVISNVVGKFNPLKAIVDGVKNAFNFLVDMAKNMFNSFGLISKVLGILSEKFPFLKKVIDPVKNIFDKLKNITGLLISGFELIKKGVQALADKFPALGNAINAVKEFFGELLDIGKRALDWLGFSSEKVEETNKKIVTNTKETTKELKEEGEKQVENKTENDNQEVESEEDKNKRLAKLRDERLKAEWEFRALQLRNMKESREKDLAEEQLRYEKEQEKYKGNKKALLEIAEFHNTKVSDINKNWDDKESEERKKKDAEELASFRKGILEKEKAFKDKLAKQKSDIDAELQQRLESNKKTEQADREAMLNGNLTANQYEENKKARASAAQADYLAQIQANNEAKIQATKDFYDNLIKAEQEKIAEKGISEIEFEAISAELKKQSAEEAKAIQGEIDLAQKEAEDAATEEHLAKLKENVEREKAIKKAGWDYAEKAAQSGLDLVTTINDNLTKNAKKQNDIQKAVTLVKIGIDSAKAISNAIANANAPTPDNVATGGIAGIAKFVAISAQIATAVAQAHKVLSTGVPSSGGSSSPSAPTVSAPQLSAPQIGGTQIIARQHNPEPIKVFVTEADIRNTQRKVAVIEGQSEVV